MQEGRRPDFLSCQGTTSYAAAEIEMDPEHFKLLIDAVNFALENSGRKNYCVHRDAFLLYEDFASQEATEI